jgi:carbon starvation protein
VIACGAISGFHSLISSGTTPRFLDKESDARVVGYGAMLVESFVGVMALVAAVTLAPGIYLAMNVAAPPGANRDGTLPPAVAAAFTAKITAYDPAFAVTPEDMSSLAAKVDEPSLYGRSGGGPSLAVGMAVIFSRTLGGRLAGFWYHFAIMFEAVFILTVLDSGTRVIRFVVQELFQDLAALRGSSRKFSPPVWLTSGLAVLGWGLILSWGLVDREGGTRALIRMFGTANQLLAAIALTLATIIALRRHRPFTLFLALPMVVVSTITLSATGAAIFAGDPRVGALAAGRDALARQAQGILPAVAAATISKNAFLTATLTGILGAFVVAVLALCLSRAVALLKEGAPE